MAEARARRAADPNQTPDELRQLDDAVALVTERTGTERTR